MEISKIFAAVVLLGIVCVIEAQQGANCHNAIITPRHFFNLSESMGPWYGHAFAAGLAENVKPLSYKCYRLEYVQTTDTDIAVTEWYLDISNGTSVPISDTASAKVTNDMLPAYWTTYNGEEAYMDIVHLHTDYRNWQVGYGCRIVDGYRHELFTVYTRQRFVDPIYTELFKTLAAGYGFAEENLQFVEQGNCL